MASAVPIFISCSPEHDDSSERYNESSERRKVLFDDLSRRFDATQLSPSIWAFLQVGDVETIRLHTANAEAWSNMYLADPTGAGIHAPLEDRATSAIRLWFQSQKCT